MNNATVQKKRFETALILLCGIVIGWLASTTLSAKALHAQDRKATPKTFLSGGERSAAVLEKISLQIATMDQRIARIETAVVGDNRKNAKK